MVTASETGEDNALTWPAAVRSFARSFVRSLAVDGGEDEDEEGEEEEHKESIKWFVRTATAQVAPPPPSAFARSRTARAMILKNSAGGGSAPVGMGGG